MLTSGKEKTCLSGCGGRVLIIAEAHTILYKPVAEIVNDDEGKCTYIGDFNRDGSK